FGDDLHLNAKRRAGVDDALLLSGIHPGHRHLRVAAGYLFDHRPATDGVLDAGRGDQHHQQKAEHVGGNVSLRSFDLLACVDSLGVFGHVAGGLDGLGVQDRRSGFGVPTRRRADLAPATRRGSLR
ncbi:MAG TPA: hypothetical protein VFB74_08980, partial [Kribbellaceae bacterium]|nr:hypothetical protein [Kribbellaceae bacterium]